MSTRPKGRRGFRVGAVIGRSFRIWGRNIVPFTLLALIVHAPIFYAEWVLRTTEDIEELLFWQNASMLGPYVLNPIVAGLIAYGVFHQLRGQPAGIGACIANGLRRFIPGILTGVVTTLLFFLGLVILVIPGIILACMLWVAVPVAVVERSGVFGAIGRSATLTKGERGSIFLIMLLTFVIILGMAFGFGVVVGMLDLEAVRTWFSPIMGAMFGLLQSVAINVGYHDLRLSKEGVGVEELVAVFD